MREKNAINRILILAPSLAGGGAEKVAVNLANYWAHNGFEVYLIAIRRVEDYRNLLSANVNYICLEKKRIRYSFMAVRHIMKKIRPLAILSVLRETNIISRIATLGWFSGPLIFREANTLHGIKLKGSFTSYFYIALMRLLYDSADKVVANSNDTLEDLHRLKIAHRNGCVIENPVLTDDWRELSFEFVNEPWLNNPSLEVVLSVGRLHPQKDFETLLRAFSLVYANKESLRLIILGQGSELGNLKALCEELKIEHVVAFPGFISNPWPYYRKAKVFVLASLWEGFGNVIVESMAVGTQVVVTKCEGGPRSILAHGEYGRLVSLVNPSEMATAISHSLDFPIAQEKVKQRALEYSVAAIAKRYGELLRVEKLS